MIPENRVPTHPGEILLEEFLGPREISVSALAAHVGVSVARLRAVIRGERRVTAEMAWSLAGAFETSPQIWIELQDRYDLARARPARSVPPIR